MGLLWNLLLGGHNAPRRSSRCSRAVYWLGNRIANCRRGVQVHSSCLIHPEAWICARDQELRIGARSAIARSTAVQGAVTIGENSSVQVNGNIVGYCGGEVRIGNGVRIAGNCMIIGANHRFDDPDRPIHSQGLDPAPIVIEDDVWIGGTVNINAGVTIGHGSVIGAGAVVTRDIPALSIAVGAPAKVVRTRSG